MLPRRWFLAIFLLCLGILKLTHGNKRTCKCINDKNDHYYGYFLCRSLHLTNLHISEFQEHQCVNISVASLEQNRLTDYPLLLKDRRFRIINLSRNKLRFLPRVDQLSRNIKSLDISWNKIVDSNDGMRNMTRLRILNVSGNSLASLAFIPAPCGLEDLDLHGNAIAAIDASLRRCTALTRLNLAQNRLNSLPREALSDLRYLEVLNLGENPLTTLTDGTFIGLSYLRRLTLTHSRISDLRNTALSGLSRLEILDLSRNNLQELTSDVFREIPNLTDLHLDGNQLSSLPDNLLFYHTRLQRLFLSDNEFMSLPLSLILEDRNSSLVINLEDNPIHPRSLSWAFTRDDVYKIVAEGRCNCGAISRQNIIVVFCMDVKCGVGQKHRYWQDAVRSIRNGTDLREIEDNSAR